MISTIQLNQRTRLDYGQFVGAWPEEAMHVKLCGLDVVRKCLRVPFCCGSLSSWGWACHTNPSPSVNEHVQLLEDAGDYVEVVLLQEMGHTIVFGNDFSGP